MNNNMNQSASGKVATNLEFAVQMFVFSSFADS